MKEELLKVANDYLEWVHVQLESDVNFIGDDYIDTIEDMLLEEGILYTQNDMTQTIKSIISKLQDKYGVNNIFYGAPEHTVIENGRYVTLYNQLIIKNPKHKE
ncbi:hypothetical protein ACTFRN_09385 [Bacillus cereus group sp. MYBK245-2]|uniref:Uncharacterized protein n=2 Tax=Bacillus cereus group TaxID=86661 RepID=A0A1Y5ZD93_9BACI|nr:MULTISPECIES: hypothetical protein [Bacillus]ONG86760.1 hypothetical protein BKK40_25870 [Bacillus cereus]MDA1507889.1 hypothetical protein [Bacillus cereus group sp. TH36-2LC]MDA1576302.1 hypothetical protein [Bacillus cereus group sp. TH242-3LC]MDA1828964.1 hypothetical protein [Bacillus cereus group sp. BY25LC]MDA1895076.1 hypothetical protein [Bacillus cereus group sp. BcHK28]